MFYYGGIILQHGPTDLGYNNRTRGVCVRPMRTRISLVPRLKIRETQLNPAAQLSETHMKNSPFMTLYKFVIHYVSKLWTWKTLFWFLLFFQFFDNLKPPGGQMQKYISVKFCTLIDFMTLYKFVIHYVSKLWTWKTLFWFLVVFFNFLTIWSPLVAKCENRNPWDFVP